MGIDNNVSVVGNVTRDPELRFTQGGMAVASFGVAWNRRKQDGEEEVSFFDVTCFRQLAENVAESITKGTRVVVAGTLNQSNWETQDGDRRSKVEILADEVAPSLRWASADVRRNEPRGGGERGGNPSSGNSGASNAGAPAPAPAYDVDEEPF
jgi:single-strand DNA-binding protein